VVLEDGGLAYEVEEILNSGIGGQVPNKFTKYWVKWKGYDVGHNSWELEVNLEGARELIEEFHQHYPKVPWLDSSKLKSKQGEEEEVPAKRKRKRRAC